MNEEGFCSRSSISVSKQGNWLLEDPPPEPDVLYKIELYHNGTFVVQLSSWLEGVSSFTKQAAVSGSWGSGSGFQVKLIKANVDIPWCSWREETSRCVY